MPKSLKQYQAEADEYYDGYYEEYITKRNNIKKWLKRQSGGEIGLRIDEPIPKEQFKMILKAQINQNYENYLDNLANNPKARPKSIKEAADMIAQKDAYELSRKQGWALFEAEKARGVISEDASYDVIKYQIKAKETLADYYDEIKRQKALYFQELSEYGEALTDTEFKRYVEQKQLEKPKWKPMEEKTYDLSEFFSDEVYTGVTGSP